MDASSETGFPDNWAVSDEFIQNIKNGRKVYLVEKVKRKIEKAILNGECSAVVENRNCLPELKEIVYSLIPKGFQISSRTHGDKGWRYASYHITWKTSDVLEKERIVREKRRADCGFPPKNEEGL